MPTMPRLTPLRLLSPLRTLVAVVLLCPLFAIAQDTPLLGTWEGPITMGRDDMMLAFTFATSGNELTAAFTSAALGVYGMPGDLVKIDGRRVTVRITRLDMEFSGTLRYDSDGVTLLRIDGDYFQRSEMIPVVLFPVATPTL